MKVYWKIYNIGEMVEGCPHGEGMLVTSSGERYTGTFLFGKF